jgi:hypothetical protein
MPTAIQPCAGYTDEDFECLILGQLAEPLDRELEAHLLFCPLCQEREHATLDYVSSIRRALQLLDDSIPALPAGLERRAFPRRRCERPVVIHPVEDHGRHISAWLRDISAGGCGLVVDQELTVNSVVTIRDGLATLRAVVRRSERVPDGVLVGVELAQAYGQVA